ncbi:cytochrome P450 4ae1 isoform X2 [Drosophila innubila]|nr:cytochrome P450 4ae1 isoform X2 [Drosophila innubila]
MVLVTSEPSLVEGVLLSKQQLRKSVVYGALGSWLGNGLLLSRGEHWHAMRKIITPAFHFNILEQHIDVFDRQCSVLIEKLKPLADSSDNSIQQAINIYPYMCLVALDIISEAAMGVGIDAQMNVDSPVVQAVKDVTNTLATRFMRPHLLFPLVFRWCWPSGYRKQHDGIKCLRNFTDDIIERRRQLLHRWEQQPANSQEVAKRAPLLDTLLQASLDGAPLTDAQIRDEVSTFIFAGHDTTTSAASFCLYLLSRNPTVQQCLFDELYAYYGSDMERSVAYNDFAQLSFLHCVVKESLRLYPPIPVVARCLEKNFVFGDANVPAGTNVILLLWKLLRDEKFYREPLRFWPERHLPNNDIDVGLAKSISSYIPFSAGPRNCIGQRFALLELKTILIKMLRHFELLPMGVDVKPSIKIVLRSATGVNLGLKTRSYTQ